MKKLLSAALAALCVTWAIPAFAQTVSYTDVAPTGERIQVPVTPAKPLPVTGSGGSSAGVPFTPSASGANVSLAVTTSTANVALGPGATQVVQNIGSAPAYLKFGGSGVTAATTDTLLLPGGCWPFGAGIANVSDHLAAITASGTATLAITGGTGLSAPAVCTDTSKPSGLAGGDGATIMGPANPFYMTLGVGCTPGGVQSASSTNATNIKASAGTFCGGHAVNTTGTIYYLRLYNLATAPTASSATGYVLTIPIPANTTGAGLLLDFGPYGAAFSTGIGFVITGGPTSTDNTNAATGVFVNYTFK